MSGLLPGFAAVERLALPDAELTWWPAWLAADAACELFAALQRRHPGSRAKSASPGAGCAFPAQCLVWRSRRRLRLFRRAPGAPCLDAEAGGGAGGGRARHRHAFNSALLNLYRSGADSVDWHSDDEAELGPAPVIAALSLGATRRFELRHRFDAALHHRLDLGDGALLLMAGDMQRQWRHRIPKEPGVAAPRISITFRRARPVRQWRADARVAEPTPGC